MKIYELIDPNTNEIMYIGKTIAETLQQRLVGHLHESYHRLRRFNINKSLWIKSLLENNQLPIITLIEETDDIKREEYWIKLKKPIYNFVFNLDNSKFISKMISKVKSIPVHQYSLLGEFIKSWKSALEAAKELNINATNISSCITGKRKQAGGYMWILNKVDELKEYKKDMNMKEVHMYSKNGDYIRSYSNARSIEGFSYKVISKCCNGKSKSYKGFKFSFIKGLRYSPNLEEIQDGCEI